ncbi:MAG: DnaJ domain-containing protein [Spirochaetales bacterium]|nr:DnaJ domain-containing protein [Spirochaetales bacterium]
MEIPLDYYQILHTEKTSPPEQIKSAFRRLAKELHPDTGGGSEEQKMKFILVHNAYRVLSDPASRREYDQYLNESRIIRKQALAAYPRLAGKEGFVYKPDEQIYAYLNFIFWEIEDYINGVTGQDPESRIGNKTIRHYLLRILVFFDKWLLTPAGFPDYFMTARKLDSTDPEDYLSRLDTNRRDDTHLPYADLKDYFYALRKRLDRFLGKFGIRQLSLPVTEYGIPLIECIIECQNYALHNLSWLLREEGPDGQDIPAFNHSLDIFRMKADQ